MTTAPLLKQNSGLSFYFSPNLLERKGRVQWWGMQFTMQGFIQALILPLGLYGTTAGIFHKLSQFPRQNCCEEVCLLTEAWEPRVILRKYRCAFIHLLLSFSFPLPRLLGPLTLSGWQCHLPHHDGERHLGKGDLSGGWDVLALDHGDGSLWTSILKTTEAHILSGRIVWCELFFNKAVLKRNFTQ